MQILSRNGILLGLHQGLKSHDIKFMHQNFRFFKDKQNHLSEKKIRILITGSRGL